MTTKYMLLKQFEKLSHSSNVLLTRYSLRFAQLLFIYWVLFCFKPQTGLQYAWAKNPTKYLFSSTTII